MSNPVYPPYWDHDAAPAATPPGAPPRRPVRPTTALRPASGRVYPPQRVGAGLTDRLPDLPRHRAIPIGPPRRRPADWSYVLLALLVYGALAGGVALIVWRHWWRVEPAVVAVWRWWAGL